MDLLGRKSKALLDKALDGAAFVLEQRNAYANLVNDQRQTLADLYAQLYSRESLISDLIRDNEYLKKHITSLLEAHADSEPTQASRPIHVSEEEDELRWQLENNMINLSDYEHLLAELDFQNADITIDPDYRPRPDLTF